jgi:hypothetical protein
VSSETEVCIGTPCNREREREKERVWTDPRIGMPHDQDRLFALAFDDNGDPYQPNQEEDERACMQTDNRHVHDDLILTFLFLICC